MSFADLLAEEIAASRPGPLCTMCRVLQSFDPKDREALQSALDDPDVPSSVLIRVLQRKGHNVRGETLRRHRKGDCLGTRA